MRSNGSVADTETGSPPDCAGEKQTSSYLGLSLRESRTCFTFLNMMGSFQPELKEKYTGGSAFRT